MRKYDRNTAPESPSRCPDRPSPPIGVGSRPPYPSVNSENLKSRAGGGASCRRGLQRSLDRAAEILSGGLSKSALTVNWAQVRYQHVTALRAVLIDAGAKPATINHVLAAVRGTLREAWRLGHIDAESLARKPPSGEAESVPEPAS